MIKLKVHDRVRIIDAPADRQYLLNQTGIVLPIGKNAAEDDVFVKLDKSGSKGFFKEHELEKISF